MAKIVIFGAGDIARIAHWCLGEDSPHEVAAFTVDSAYRQGESFLDLPLVDFERAPRLYPPGEYAMFVALSYAGMNAVRTEKYHRCKELGYELVTYVSSRCTWLAETPPGDNCLILEDNTVQPFVTIGRNVTLWSGNHIGHDAVIEDHCFISSHVVVSGRVRVGASCFLGVNATIHNGVNLSPGTLVGAGSIISRDTGENSVHVPARSRCLENRDSSRVDL